ncbi:MAG: hypothetical protein LCH92_08100 [Proteobacteria bacterium]|nr:hypothetical protein [Pseudomonadota bacterium]
MTKVNDTIDSIQHTLVSAWAAGGTLAIAYPSGRGPGSYGGGTKHRITSREARALEAERNEITVKDLASTVSITNNSQTSFPAGAIIWIELDRSGAMLDADNLANDAAMSDLFPVMIDLGSPVTSDSDGAVASQAATAAGGLETGINGALAEDGVATFDVPRNVVAAWTGTAVLTVTGTDEFGETMVESSGSGTSMTGAKAFKTITGISVSADVTGLTVGNSKVFGLPAYAPAGAIIKEVVNGAVVTNGTFVAGATAVATATTGDVRGTYAPNANPNGSTPIKLMCLLPSRSFRGVAQFAG